MAYNSTLPNKMDRVEGKAVKIRTRYQRRGQRLLQGVVCENKKQHDRHHNRRIDPPPRNPGEATEGGERSQGIFCGSRRRHVRYILQIRVLTVISHGTASECRDLLLSNPEFYLFFAGDNFESGQSHSMPLKEGRSEITKFGNVSF